MAAIYRELGEDDLLPARLLASLPILGWEEDNRVQEPIMFANVVARDLSGNTVVRTNTRYCEAWLEELARHLLSEHVAEIGSQDLIVTRCYTSLKYQPNADPEPLTPTLSVSIHVRLQCGTTHHLNAKMKPLPNRVLVPALQAAEEDSVVEMWGLKVVQHAWLWEMWSVMDQAVLEVRDLQDAVTLHVREDGTHVVERFFEGFACPAQ
jgi:hypothetical protein